MRNSGDLREEGLAIDLRTGGTTFSAGTTTRQLEAGSASMRGKKGHSIGPASITFDTWGHYDRNPDHWMTARAAETALWVAGGRKDYPEHFDAALEPSRIRETYYYARGPQLVNRIVDISSVIDIKAKSLQVCQTQGPGVSRGSRLKKELAAKGMRLPLLGDDDERADLNYIKEFALEHNRKLGQEYGLQWAERFR